MTTLLLFTALVSAGIVVFYIVGLMIELVVILVRKL